MPLTGSLSSILYLPSLVHFCSSLIYIVKYSGIVAHSTSKPGIEAAWMRTGLGGTCGDAWTVWASKKDIFM